MSRNCPYWQSEPKVSLPFDRFIKTFITGTSAQTHIYKLPLFWLVPKRRFEDSVWVTIGPDECFVVIIHGDCGGGGDGVY